MKTLSFKTKTIVLLLAALGCGNETPNDGCFPLPKDGFDLRLERTSFSPPDCEDKLSETGTITVWGKSGHGCTFEKTGLCEWREACTGALSREVVLYGAEGSLFAIVTLHSGDCTAEYAGREIIRLP